MRYERDPGLEGNLSEIVGRLGMHHVDLDRISCVRSWGTKSRRVLARCHTISKVVQLGLGVPAHYIIEIVSENFDRLSPDDKMRTLIHELMHIPLTFGGGFRHHKPYVTRKTVESMYKIYKESFQY